MFDCLGYYALIGGLLARNRPAALLQRYAKVRSSLASRLGTTLFTESVPKRKLKVYIES